MLNSMPRAIPVFSSLLLIWNLVWPTSIAAAKDDLEEKNVAMTSVLPTVQAPESQKKPATHPVSPVVKPYQEAIHSAVRSSYPSTHFQKGLYFKQKHDLNKALIEFLKSTQENPRLVRGFYEQALIFRERGYLKLAESSLEQALAANPNYSEARVLLATIRIQQGNVGGAVQELSRSLGLAFNEPQKPADVSAPAPTVLQSIHTTIHPAAKRSDKPLIVDKQPGKTFSFRGYPAIDDKKPSENKTNTEQSDKIPRLVLTEKTNGQSDSPEDTQANGKSNTTAESAKEGQTKHSDLANITNSIETVLRTSFVNGWRLFPFTQPRDADRAEGNANGQADNENKDKDKKDRHSQQSERKSKEHKRKKKQSKQDRKKAKSDTEVGEPARFDDVDNKVLELLGLQSDKQAIQKALDTDDGQDHTTKTGPAAGHRQKAKHKAKNSSSANSESERSNDQTVQTNQVNQTDQPDQAKSLATPNKALWQRQRN